MAEDVARGADEGDPEITVGVQVDQPDIAREACLQIMGVPADLAVDDRFAGRAIEIELDVLGERVATPERQRPHARVGIVRALRHEHVLNGQRRGKMIHEGGEECGPGCERGAVEHGPQHLARARTNVGVRKSAPRALDLSSGSRRVHARSAYPRIRPATKCRGPPWPRRMHDATNCDISWLSKSAFGARLVRLSLSIRYDDRAA